MKRTLCLIILFVVLALALSGFLLARTQSAPATVAATAAELTAGCGSTEEKAMAVYRYMTRNFQYDYALCDAIRANAVTTYTPDSEQTLNDRKGICCDLAVLYAAMLESQQVEVTIVKGYYNGVYHAWNSVYDEEAGAWRQVDVTSDLWYGRKRTAWPAFDTARHVASASLDYSVLTPLTFGAGS